MDTAVYEKTCAAIRDTMHTARELSENDRLVLDLGFDSLRIATLSIAIEEEFGAVILLNEWLSSVDDPDRLTVGSLANYLAGATAGDTEVNHAVP